MRLSHPRRTQQDYVLRSLDEAHPGEVLDLLSRSAHRELEVELVQCRAQPFAHLHVGRRRVHLEAERAQPAVQRNPETVAQIMNEALDLALGLRPVRAAKQRQKAMMMGKVAEPGL